MSAPRNIIILMLAGLLFFTCCKEKALSWEQYAQWLAMEGENAVSKQATVNDITVRVTLLPAGYLAIKEYRSMDRTTKNTLDSLKKYYAASLTFLVSFIPVQSDNRHDLNYYNVYDRRSYAERFMKLSFDMKEDFSLMNSQGFECAPLLYHFENIYGMKESRSAIVVFPNILREGQEISLSYNDEVLDLGMLSFRFSDKDLKESPQLDPGEI